MGFALTFDLLSAPACPTLCSRSKQSARKNLLTDGGHELLTEQFSTANVAPVSYTHLTLPTKA